jgi:hypothetical protein
MPLCGATTNENAGGTLRAATFLGDKTFRVAAGTAPLTFIELFSSETAARLCPTFLFKNSRLQPATGKALAERRSFPGPAV